VVVAETKNLLLRLDPELAAQLQAVAEVEERPMSEVVREAIRSLIEARRTDKDFQRRLRDSAREHDRTLRALRTAADDDTPDRG
jgi:predicted DNA-binding protein